MNDVVSGGPGFVAVGGAPDRPATTQVAEHAVVWTSKDGRTWSRLPDAPVYHAPAGTDQAFGDTMSSIASDGTHLVAVGTVATQGDVGSALAWISTDGRTWRRGSAGDFLNGQLFTVATVPGGFLGTGPSGTDSCLGGIWLSTDGTAWTCIATDSSIGGYRGLRGCRVAHDDGGGRPANDGGLDPGQHLDPARALIVLDGDRAAGDKRRNNLDLRREPTRPSMGRIRCPARPATRSRLIPWPPTRAAS